MYFYHRDIFLKKLHWVYFLFHELIKKRVIYQSDPFLSTLGFDWVMNGSLDSDQA